MAPLALICARGVASCVGLIWIDLADVGAVVN
jgi:hypothetical protein